MIGIGPIQGCPTLYPVYIYIFHWTDKLTEIWQT